MSSEYMPNTEAVKDQYTQEQPPQIGTISEKSAEFDRWLAAELAAAEWRGAVRALRDFRRFMFRAVPRGLVSRNQIIADVEESIKRIDETGYMLMGPLDECADRMEVENG